MCMYVHVCVCSCIKFSIFCVHFRRAIDLIVTRSGQIKVSITTIPFFLSCEASLSIVVRPLPLSVLSPPPLLHPQVLACLANNTLEVWTLAVSPKDKNIERTVVLPLAAPGHTADVRCVSFSSDDTCIVSGSASELKVWNRASQQCIHTLPSGYALCTMFAPGNRHIFLGTKVNSNSLYHRIC